MEPVIFTIFGVSIRWYSLLILIGIIIGIFLVMKEAKKFNLNQDTIFNMCFYAIIIGIIGARLYYVLFNISYYRYNLIEIFEIWNGGLAIHGGIIAGAITIYIYAKKHKINFMRLLDILVPSVILAQAIGRWGNFFNSEAHGFATTLNALQKMYIPSFIIKGMYIDGIYYLPTFYFESLWCTLGFIILLIIRHLKYVKVGTTTALYLMFGGFKIAQIVSVILFISSLIYLIYIYRQGKYANLYNDINKGRVN